MVKRVFAFASVMVVTATLVVPAFAQDAKKAAPKMEHKMGGKMAGGKMAGHGMMMGGKMKGHGMMGGKMKGHGMMGGKMAPKKDGMKKDGGKM